MKYNLALLHSQAQVSGKKKKRKEKEGGGVGGHTCSYFQLIALGYRDSMLPVEEAKHNLEISSTVVTLPACIYQPLYILLCACLKKLGNL